MTAQLLISGTTEEIQDILNKLNGTSKTEEVSVSKAEKKKKPEQPELDLSSGEEITVDQLRLLVQAKAKAGKREEIKKLIKTFGAASVTELDEKFYAEFKEKLNDL